MRSEHAGRWNEENLLQRGEELVDESATGDVLQAFSEIYDQKSY